MVDDINPLPEVTIYTDGACITNPGPGGYGAGETQIKPPSLF